MMLLRTVMSGKIHHPGVRMVLVVTWAKPDMGQDAEVAGTSSQHCPEQVIIASNQLVSVTKLTEESREIS